ncbi:MAG: hypothetical protein AABX51_08830 [Nanoarchaeota archaeon]
MRLLPLLFFILVIFPFVNAQEQSGSSGGGSSPFEGCSIAWDFSTGQQYNLTLSGINYSLEVIGVNTQSNPQTAVLKIGDHIGQHSKNETFYLDELKVEVLDIFSNQQLPGTGAEIRLSNCDALNEIPEFSGLASLLGIIGAGSAYLVLRRKK